MKFKVEYPDTDRGDEITVERLEIVMDPDDGRYIWIYMLDENGTRVEGGGFNKDAFMSHIRKFYDENF